MTDFTTPVANGTESTSGAQAISGEDPFGALNQEEQAENQYNYDLHEFNKLAKENPGEALMYAAMDLLGSLINYQGAMMNIQASLMDTVSLLNSNLNNINSDINNIFQDFESKSSDSKIQGDIQSFLNDSYQYYVNLDFYFKSGGNLEENGTSVDAPFKNDTFYESIKGDFKTFQVTSGNTTESLFKAFDNVNSTNWDDVGGSLETMFKHAYKGASGSSSGSDSSMQSIEDVVTNAETQQNEINSTASTNLSADQQNINSYEGIMNASLTAFSQLFQTINNQLSQASS